MARTQRLFEILITLQTKPRFTVKALADEFGVSRRTMLRDLHTLSELGVPLAATPGPYGGYSLINKRRLFPLSLSVDEAIGIVLSYEALLQYAQSPFAEGSLSAITKIRNALPPDVVREMDALRSHIVVTQRRIDVDAPLLSHLLRASVDGTHLRITYESRSGPSERIIFPYGIFASAGFWYCACYDYRRNEAIFLRADRVQSAEPIRGIEPARPSTVRDFLRTYGTSTAEEVRFRATVTRRAAMSFELNSLFGEIPVADDGKGVLETDLPRSELEWFAGHFLSLGPDLRVEEPAELVELMREKARAIVQLYE